MDDDEALDGHNSGPEDELSDEDLMAANAEPDVPADDEPDPHDKEEEERLARMEEKYQDLLALREERTHFWTQEPEKATKIFLSSHFRDKGLMWCVI